MTRDQLVSFIEEKYGFYLMEYQKTALWQFYRTWMTNKDFVFIHGRGNGKMFMYKIMKELLEYEHQMKEE